jgi:O-antigen ligase
VLKSNNELFSCTGTWANPNVAALFLAFSCLPLLQLNVSNETITNANLKKAIRVLPVIIIVAIVLLKCRSSYIITTLFFAGYYYPYIKKYFANQSKLSSRAFIIAISVLFVCASIFLEFKYKKDSTNGRLRIWENTIELITQKPVTGFGIGMYEREYNLYIAQHAKANADHVFMAYNDFLELATEGGLIALLLWVAFLISFTLHHQHNRLAILLIAGLVVM